MNIGQTLYVTNRKAWRAWLQKNFQTTSEIWLIFPRKASGKVRISYNDAVEEALCFGWIDSIVKRLDDQRTAQRFSPRKASHQSYSQPNLERLKLLVKQNKIHPSLKAVVTRAVQAKFVFPPDILAAIKRNKTAWQHYQRFSPGYRRIRLAYIEGARARPDEFKKRLQNFITLTEQNKQIGFGGIEKYY